MILSKSTTILILLFLSLISGAKSSLKLTTQEVLSAVKEQREKPEITNSAYEQVKKSITEKATPVLADNLTSVDTLYKDVIAIGNLLRNSIGKPADSITIHTDLYWRAHGQMSMTNPLIFQARTFKLIEDGQLDRARYLLFFTQLNTRSSDKNNLYLLQMLAGWLQQIHKEKQQYVNKGIKLFDQGKRGKALNEFITALAYSPNDAHSLYEIGLTFMTDNLSGHVAATMDDAESKKSAPDFRASDFYALARKSDPFYLFAYQGKVSKTKYGKNALAAQEAYKTMRKEGLSREQIKIFADNCYVMKEFEFAAYAYKYLMLFELSDDKNYSDYALKNYCNSVKALGANEASQFIANQYKIIRESLGSK